MDSFKENIKDHRFFVEDSISSGSEEETCYRNYQKNTKKLSRESSPPIILAFSITSGQTLQEDTSSVSSVVSEEHLEEDSDHQPIEDWMMLEGEDQMEDKRIQLNLDCWDSSDEGDGEEDMTDKTGQLERDPWAISDKDKFKTAQSRGSRYFLTSHSSICNICNRTGHVSKNCYYQKQKIPTCVLCGVQGHVQRDCPNRPCSTCGLPSHGLSPCKVPPVWKQHCQRCGLIGHVSDACPDTWRQYHLTVSLGVPFRPRIVCSGKPKSHFAHCYNCSKRGHYGHECVKRRMISGTFPSLPYVCHYDTLEEILQQELLKGGSLHASEQGQLANKTGALCKDRTSVQGRSNTKQEAGSNPGRRRTWPERRRERREVKRLRREAQAKREGGLLARHCCTSDDGDCSADPSGYVLQSQRQPKPLLRVEKIRKKSRKSREADRWRKRGGIKRGHLNPHSDLDIGSENFLSPKQRVRHRRR